MSDKRESVEAVAVNRIDIFRQGLGVKTPKKQPRLIGLPKGIQEV